jgi:hypothetical protein
MLRPPMLPFSNAFSMAALPDVLELEEMNVTTYGPAGNIAAERVR